MNHYLLFLSSILVAGCSGTKTTPTPAAVTSEPPSFIVRVQSSYGDLQQVEVSVKEWFFNGEERRQFDKKTTPFDIPFAAGDFSMRLHSPQGEPKIKLQLLKGENKRIGYLQSNDVCVRGYANGEFEIQDCMDGLR